MKSPLFSIVVPTYNRAHLLEETIRSVLFQSYSDWELIIVDDGSTDQTRALVESFRDPRIQFHAFAHSANYAIVRNRGLKLCSGDLIAFLDSDDLWDAQKLSNVAAFFSAHPSSKFLLSNVTLFGITTSQSPELEDKLDCSLFEDLIEERNIVFYPSALVFKKEILNQVGMLNETMPKGADHDFILRLSSQFKGSFLYQRLSLIRKHPSNTSSNDEINIYQDSIGHVERFFRNGLISRKKYRKLTAGYYYKLAGILGKKGDTRSSHFFMKSIKVNPMRLKTWVRYLLSLVS